MCFTVKYTLHYPFKVELGTDTSEYVTEFGLVKTAYTWMEKRDIAFKVLCR